MITTEHSLRQVATPADLARWEERGTAQKIPARCAFPLRFPRLLGPDTSPNLAHLLGRLISVVVIAVLAASCRAEQRIPASRMTRFVSLSPAITETLFAIGAGPFVVGVSDYCHYPLEVERLPHVGSGYTPRYEAIVGLTPTVVFVERVNEETGRDLAKVLNVKFLSWLTLEQVAQSTRQLGQLTGHEAAAERTARAYEETMKSRIAANSPRILLVMPHPAGQLREAWFIRRNSIHGRVLEAAGAINAVTDDVNGPPHLSLEQVIRLDPDGIIILEDARVNDTRLAHDWQQLRVLAAVQKNHIQQIAVPGVTIPGPRIIDFVERLSPWIHAWSKVP
jgi:ABC-type Fe3+-hydroxamate transport system substrate-binding protein